MLRLVKKDPVPGLELGSVFLIFPPLFPLLLNIFLVFHLLLFLFFSSVQP